MRISKKHRRLRLRTVIKRKISDFPAQQWNAVFPDILEGYDFYRCLDASGLSQFSLYYIMVYDGKKPVAATTCFQMEYALDTGVTGPLRRLTNSLRKLAPRIISIKMIMCGMPLGQGRIGFGLEDRDAAMQAILRALERIARKTKAMVVAFKDFDQSYAGLLGPLERRGFLKIDALPSTELEVNFKDFEGYLKTLSSATRYDLRRKFKQVDGKIKITTETKTLLSQDELEDVYRLYLEMTDKHEMNFELLPKEFFSNISHYMPGRCLYFLWRLEGKMVAFMLGFASDKLFMDYYLGLDYSVAYTYHLYFVKFRDTLSWCIKQGIKKYDMGYTGYETKVRLNFSLIPQYLYIKIRYKVLYPVFKLVCHFLRFENFDADLQRARKHK